MYGIRVIAIFLYNAEVEESKKILKDLLSSKYNDTNTSATFNTTNTNNITSKNTEYSGQTSDISSKTSKLSGIRSKIMSYHNQIFISEN
eukprot:jgi/Orpsp1_1/1188907/evm.model.d7180000068097.1